MAYTPISTKTSEYLAKELNYSEEKKEILAYAVENVILTVIGFVMVMTVGFILGAPVETLFTALSGGILRKFSGGAHAGTRKACLAIGAVIYPGAGWVFKTFSASWGYPLAVTAFFGFIALLLVYRYAPVDSPAKPIISMDFRRKLRKGAIVTIVVFFGLAVLNTSKAWALPLAGGLFIQSLSLLPILNKGGEKNA